MKKLLIILFLVFSSQVLIVAKSKNILGKVYSVKGDVFASYKTENSAKVKHKLRKGDKVYSGVTIFTNKKSEMVIKFKNGVYKFIPNNSSVSLLNQKLLKIYKKADKSVEKLMATLGTKAYKNQKKWFSERKEKEAKIAFFYKKKQYFNIVKFVSSSKVPLTPYANYLAAVSYFKMGNDLLSIKYFKKLIDLNIDQFNEAAYFGLFLNYIRLNQIAKAKTIYNNFKANYYDSSFKKEMEKLLEV